MKTIKKVVKNKRTLIVHNQNAVNAIVKRGQIIKKAR